MGMFPVVEAFVTVTAFVVPSTQTTMGVLVPTAEPSGMVICHVPAPLSVVVE